MDPPTTEQQRVRLRTCRDVAHLLRREAALAELDLKAGLEVTVLVHCLLREMRSAASILERME